MLTSTLSQGPFQNSTKRKASNSVISHWEIIAASGKILLLARTAI
jgi:hypothetical protein